MEHNLKVLDITTLQEADLKLNKEKKELNITFLQEGTSKRKNYYSPEVIERAPQRFQKGTKLYKDHQSPDKVGKEARSLDDWVGSVQESWSELNDKNKKVARARVAIRNNEFWNLIESAVAGGYLDELGISVDALAKTKYGNRDGETVQVVEDIVQGRSIDFVTEASAGGKIDAVLESAITEGVKTMLELKNLTEQELKEVNPDLVKKIQEAAVIEAKKNFDTEKKTLQESYDSKVAELQGIVMSNKELLLQEAEVEINNIHDGYEKQVSEILEAAGIQIDEKGQIIKESDPGQPAVEVSGNEELSKIQESIVAMSEQIDAMQKGISERDTTIASLQGRLGSIVSRATVLTLLEESSLPEISKNRIIQESEGMSEAEIKAMIKRESEYVNAINPHGAVKNNGKSIQESDPKKARDAEVDRVEKLLE